MKNCVDYKPIWPGPPVGDGESKEEGNNKQTSLLADTSLPFHEGSSEEFNSAFLLGMKIWLVQGKRSG